MSFKCMREGTFKAIKQFPGSKLISEKLVSAEKKGTGRSEASKCYSLLEGSGWNWVGGRHSKGLEGS